jgi:hypothetical protein
LVALDRALHVGALRPLAGCVTGRFAASFGGVERHQGFHALFCRIAALSWAEHPSRAGSPPQGAAAHLRDGLFHSESAKRRMASVLIISAGDMVS